MHFLILLTTDYCWRSWTSLSYTPLKQEVRRRPTNWRINWLIDWPRIPVSTSWKWNTLLVSVITVTSLSSFESWRHYCTWWGKKTGLFSKFITPIDDEVRMRSASYSAFNQEYEIVSQWCSLRAIYHQPLWLNHFISTLHYKPYIFGEILVNRNQTVWTLTLFRV